MTTIEITNPEVEAYLYKNAQKNNTRLDEYLSNIVLNYIELESVKDDLTQMQTDINKVNNGDIKLKSAYSLIDEL